MGCSIVAKHLFGDEFDLNDVEYCNYNDINERVKEYFEKEKYKDYSHTFITDISVNEEVAEIIQKAYMSNDTPHVKLIDHHKTALWLNDKYPMWSRVSVNDKKHPDNLSCGTSLFHYYLMSYNSSLISKINPDYVFSNEALDKFVEIVRKYDTWEWKKVYNDEEPNRWNKLMKISGREKFIDKVLKKLFINDVRINNEELILLEDEEKNCKRYMNMKLKNLIIKDVCGYKSAVVFAERYMSELGNYISEKCKEDIDMIVLINPSLSISYRSIKEDIDVSKVASKFGGGGHKQASGSPITDYGRECIVDLLFNNLI